MPDVKPALDPERQPVRHRHHRYPTENEPVAGLAPVHLANERHLAGVANHKTISVRANVATNPSVPKTKTRAAFSRPPPSIMPKIAT